MKKKKKKKSIIFYRERTATQRHHRLAVAHARTHTHTHIDRLLRMHDFITAIFLRHIFRRVHTSEKTREFFRNADWNESHKTVRREKEKRKKRIFKRNNTSSSPSVSSSGMLYESAWSEVVGITKSRRDAIEKYSSVCFFPFSKNFDPFFFLFFFFLGLITREVIKSNSSCLQKVKSTHLFN